MLNYFLITYLIIPVNSKVQTRKKRKQKSSNSTNLLENYDAYFPRLLPIYVYGKIIKICVKLKIGL